jgi:mRNA interferase RelE/StbE
MYAVKFTNSAQKQLQKLPSNIQNKIVQKVQELSKEPRQHGYKKLAGREGYRVRVGDYRVIYFINDDVLTILIIDIDHRKQIYK